VSCQPKNRTIAAATIKDNMEFFLVIEFILNEW
jgi:hypothetical protein